MTKIEKDTLKQFAEILKLTEDELKKILKLYDDKQEELEKIIFDVVKKYGSYEELKKYNRMLKIDKQISDVIKDLNKKETKLITSALALVFVEGYYRNAFVLEKNLKMKINFKLLKKEIIQEVVNMPIEGLTFSERLYANQLKLKQNVKSVLIEGILKGKDIKTMAKNLDEKMNIGRNNAKRIVRTETARIHYQAQRKIWEDSGVVKKVIYIATLDNRTSEICRNRDGKVYVVGKEPPLPAHPNCRSTYGAYFDDIKIKQRKDNISKDFIKYQTYEEWRKNRVK